MARKIIKKIKKGGPGTSAVGCSAVPRKSAPLLRNARARLHPLTRFNSI